MLIFQTTKCIQMKAERKDNLSALSLIEYIAKTRLIQIKNVLLGTRE